MTYDYDFIISSGSTLVFGRKLGGPYHCHLIIRFTLIVFINIIMVM